MARTFNGTDSRLTVSATPVSAVALTMACWANVANVTANHTLISIADVASDIRYFRIYAAGADAGDFAKFDSRDGTLATAASSLAYTASTWQHYCGVSAASNDRIMYLDGGNSGNNTTSVTPSLLDATDIGVLGRLTPAQFCNGSIAEVAIWSAALNASEVASLAKGVSPRLVRPQSLAFYVPLVREIQDLRGGLTITASGTATTVTSGPRKFGP